MNEIVLWFACMIKPDSSYRCICGHSPLDHHILWTEDKQIDGVRCFCDICKGFKVR